MDIAQVRFQELSETEVLAALIDPDDEVSREVVKLSAYFVRRFAGEMEKRGYIPPHVMHIKARWPIELVAIRRAKMEITEKYLA